MAGKKISPESQVRWQLIRMLVDSGLKVGDSKSNNGLWKISETDTPEAAALEVFESTFADFGIVERESTLEDRSFTLNPGHPSFRVAVGKIVAERTSEELTATHPSQTQPPKLGAIVKRFLDGDDIGFEPGLPS